MSLLNGDVETKGIWRCQEHGTSEEITSSAQNQPKRKDLQVATNKVIRIGPPKLSGECISPFALQAGYGATGLCVCPANFQYCLGLKFFSFHSLPILNQNVYLLLLYVGVCNFLLKQGFTIKNLPCV